MREYGVPSPLEQSRRHANALKTLLVRLEIAPRMGNQMEFHHIVLVDPKATITRPPAKAFDTSMVIKADSFPEWHKRFVDVEFGVLDVVKGLANVRSADTLKEWGEKLLREHRPVDLLKLPDFMAPNASAAATPGPAKSQATETAHASESAPLSAAVREPTEPPVKKLICAHCGAKISFAEGKFCWNNAKRFDLHAAGPPGDFHCARAAVAGILVPLNELIAGRLMATDVAWDFWGHRMRTAMGNRLAVLLCYLRSRFEKQRRQAVKAKLLVAVVADELEEAAREIARREGARGMTLLSARGMNFPEYITFFGLTYLGIETLLVALLDEDTAVRVAERMNVELKLLEPHKGLAFCLPVSGTGGIDIEALHRHIAEHAPADRLEGAGR